MFYQENEYLNNHLTTIVNFDNFTICSTVLSNNVIETTNCFFSNTFCYIQIKGWLQWFSMQVVMNKCFLLNPDKNLVHIRLVVFEKNAKTHTIISKNDVNKQKARLL